MKSFVNVNFWTSNNMNIDFSYYCYPFYYHCFSVSQKNYKYISVRNFYKL